MAEEYRQKEQQALCRHLAQQRRHSPIPEASMLLAERLECLRGDQREGLYRATLVDDHLDSSAYLVLLLEPQTDSARLHGHYEVDQVELAALGLRLETLGVVEAILAGFETVRQANALRA